MTIIIIPISGCKRKSTDTATTSQTIHEAARKGDKVSIEEFLNKGVQVNKRDNLGFTPLDFASWYGHLDIVKILIANGADVGSRDKNLMTPLHWASAYGRKEVAEFLIEEDADIHAKNQNGGTPLSATTMGGGGNCKGVAELLIANGADVNVKLRDGATALHRAVLNGQPTILELLLSEGANADAKDHLRKTPLDQAITLSETRFRRGSPMAKRKKAFNACVEILREHGAK